LKDLLRPDNYKKITPIANNFEEAVTYLKKIYGNVDGIFIHVIVHFIIKCSRYNFTYRISASSAKRLFLLRRRHNLEGHFIAITFNSILWHEQFCIKEVLPLRFRFSSQGLHFS